jgi:hypothetical protein
MIKNKLKPLLLIGMAVFINTFCHAQSINFNFSNGNNAAYNLEDVRKITFSDNVMHLLLWDSSIYSWNVSTISYYDYNPNPASISEVLEQANSWQVKVYPNPTNNSINLNFNLPSDDNLSFAFFDLQGKMLFETPKKHMYKGLNEQSIDLSSYPNGKYLVQLNGQNSTITKTIIKN